MEQDSYTIAVDKDISLRICLDGRPHHFKSAGIQKGMVLIYRGEEIVEGGLGFGTPAVRYVNNTYFSKDAQIVVSQDGDRIGIVKSFEMNAVLKRKLRDIYINSPLFYFIIERISDIHRNWSWKMYRRAAQGMSTALRKFLDVRTSLVSVMSRGEIKVSYHVHTGRVRIRADLTRLDRSSSPKVFLLNEQGASLFTRYSDSSGLTLIGDEIGPWDRVEADKAWLSDLSDGVRFCLRNVEGATLYRGRESIPEYLAWSGLTYELPPSVTSFDYDVEVKGSVIE